MYVLVVAISGGDVVATSVVAKSAPSLGRNSQGVAVVGDSVKIVPASHIGIRLSVTLSVSSFAAGERK